MKINFKKKPCVYAVLFGMACSYFAGIPSRAEELSENVDVNTATETDAYYNADDISMEEDGSYNITDISTDTDAGYEEIGEEYETELLLAYSTISSDEAYDRMIAIMPQYPTGMTWTNDNYYKWNCGWGAWGCMGFAHLVSDAAFGNAGFRTLYKSDISGDWFDAIRVGDVLRVPYDEHSVTVLQIYDDYVVVAEGNASRAIRWGRTISKDTINSECSYIETRYAADAQTITISPETGYRPWMVDVGSRSFEIETGDTYKFSATIMPKNSNATIRWTSSNPSAVEVSQNGTINGKSAGKAVITATYVETGVSSSCEVVCQVDYATRYASVQSFLTRLYEKCLDREPDETGMNTWTDMLMSKKGTGASVAKGFVYSDEYIGKNVSDEEYVNMLYRVFLDREADEGGKSTWLGLMEQGISRDYVFRGFVESSEYTNLCKNYGIERGTVTLTQPRDKNPNMTKFINRLYVYVLERSGETEGLNNWCQVLQNKFYTPVQVGDFFVLSDEFEAKNLSDEEYIKVLYRAYLGREYDEEGLNTWLNQLASGKSREEVLRGFTNSVEFGKIIKSFGL
ncbi:MAG: DUF4214 domain-containing protein [Clostridium sp.]|nr:DUF4214 domain-containing protein [Clostridium sp.]